MWHGIGAQTSPGRRGLPGASTGCRVRHVLSVDDLTDEWGVILEERFAMYRELREETLRQGLPAGDEEFYAAYGKLVELVKARVLGGGRFAAEKPIR